MGKGLGAVSDANKRTLNAINFLERVFARFGTWPDYERILQISYESFLQPDHVILDVGANIGTHLEHFVRIAKDGRVLAFEPLPDLFDALVRRFHPDGFRLSLYNVAVSHSPAESADFVRAEGSLAESGLRRREYNNPAAVKPSLITVRVETLDNVVAAAKLQRIDYIKMDIEGGELDALQGASRTLSECRPIVSVEYGPQAFTAYGYNQDSLFEFGREIRYKVFDPFLQFIGTRELWDEAKCRYCWDYFLVPEERAHLLNSPFFS
jgi:FkbM family methyltransferase